jgi:hypothetical protein
MAAELQELWNQKRLLLLGKYRQSDLAGICLRYSSGGTVGNYVFSLFHLKLRT